MFKRGLAILVSASMLLTMVGCGGKQEDVAAETPAQTEDGKVVVKMWRHEGTPSESEYYAALVEDFNSSQDAVEIQVTSLPDNTYGEQVNAAILSGDLPDILDLDGPQMAGFVNAGALAPLDDYVTDELLTDVLPSLVAQGTYDDGKLYALGQF